VQVKQFKRIAVFKWKRRMQAFYSRFGTMQVKEYCEHEILRDGSPVIVRAIKPHDKQALQNALSRLSAESVYSRFFYKKQRFSSRELEFFTNVDFEQHVALGVGLLENDEMLPIGIARYIVEASNPTRAEVAFTVDDDYQGIGVGSTLLAHLILIARSRGIEEFFAAILPSNNKMVHVFEHAGLPISRSVSSEVVEISLRLG